jgi:hypothetical protein
LQFVKLLMEGTLHKNTLGILRFAFMIIELLNAHPFTHLVTKDI